VRVAAAGINPGDKNIRAGKVAQFGRPPFTLGSDVSGTVVAVADDVTRLGPGDEVFGLVAMGAYADYVAAPAEDLAIKPPKLDHVDAAALPVAGLTAWQGLVELADVQPGERVLIHAAAGGVGHLAVQVAKLRGAHVIGTARTAKHDFLSDLGADDLVDYTTTDFTQAVHDVDVVLDLVGGDYGPRSLEALRPGGLLITATLDRGVTEGDAAESGRRLAALWVRPAAPMLETLAEHVVAGHLRIAVARTFAFEHAAIAARLSDSGRVAGKLVLVA
jgi:NADPH:quinone reductase-like Zn-dependent oxidoreductase